MSDAWDDEGFGVEDDWEGGQSIEADIEEDALASLGAELDDAEGDEPEDDPLSDEEV